MQYVCVTCGVVARSEIHTGTGKSDLRCDKGISSVANQGEAVNARHAGRSRYL